MAEDILGISGHLDISDIDRSINEIIENLDKIGVKTDVLSKRMSDAMRDIANSTDDAATKQKRAMDVLSQGIAEAKAALANYPEQIHLAKDAMQQTEVATTNLEKELAKLNNQLQGSVVGSAKYEELKTSIAGVEQQIYNNTKAYQAQYATVQQMEAGYNGLVSMLGLANTATAANAVAHGTVTAVTLVEAGAHAQNAAIISQESDATEKSTEAKKQLTAAQKEAISAIKPFQKEIEDINKEFSNTGDIKKAIEQYDALIAKVEELYNAENKKTTNFIGKNGERSDEWNEYITSADYSEAQQKAIIYGDALKELRDAKSQLASSTKEVSMAQHAENQSTEEVTKNTERSISSFKAQWNAVNELHSKIQSLTQELRTYEDEYSKMAEKPGFDEQSKKAQELQEKISKLKKEISDTRKEMADEGGAGGFLAKFKNQLVDALTGNGKFQASLGNMKTALGGLLGPFTAATAGASAFAKALWSMAATPIGAVIGAIVLGLKAIHTWMTKDAEGQRAYAKITAYLGSLLKSIMDIAVKVGKYLFHAFADPQGALNQFGRGMIGMVVNPLKMVANTLAGVGKITKGVLDLIASGANVAEAKRAVGEITDGWDRLKTAAGNVVDTLKSGWDYVAGSAKGGLALIGKGIQTLWETDLSKLGSNMFSKAAKAAQLAEREVNANKELSEAKMKQHELEIKIAEEREKIYTLTGKEKDAQIELVKNLLKQKYQPQIQAQQKLLDIQKERNNLHTKSLEQLSKEREAQSAVYQVQAQAAASTRMLVRMQQANLKSMANAGKKDARQEQTIADAQTHLEDIIYKNSIARAKFEQQIEQKITDARIAAMKDGAEKVMAEKNRQLEKELEQLDEQRKAAVEAERARQKAEFEAQEKIIKARGGKTKQWSDKEIDQTAIDSINAQYETLRKIAVQRQQKDEAETQRKAMREYLKEFGSFQQQKLSITQEYNDKIKEAEAKNSTWEVELLQEQKKAALSSVDAKALREGIDWTLLFDGFSNAFQGQIKATLNNIEAYMKTKDFAKLDDVNKAEFVKLRNELSNKTGGSVGTFNFSIYNKIGKQMDGYFDTLKEANDAERKHYNATSELIIAQQNLTEAEAKVKTETATQADILALENAKKDFNTKKAVYDTTKANYESQQSKANLAKSNLQKSVTDARKSIDNFGKALDQMTNGTLRGLADGLINLYNAISGNGLTNGIEGIGSLFKKTKNTIDAVEKKTGDVNKSIENAGNNVKESSNIVNNVTDGVNNEVQKAGDETKSAASEVGSIVTAVATIAGESGNIYGMIIAAIFDLLDILGKSDAGIAGFIDELLDKIIKVIDVVIEQVFNGKLFESIFENIGELIGTLIRDIFEKILGQIFNGRFFSEGIFKGIFGSLFRGLGEALGINWTGSNAKEYEKENKRLLDSQQALTNSINKLKESFDKYNGIKAVEISDQIVKDQERLNATLMERWINDMHYHGNHTSNAYQWTSDDAMWGIVNWANAVLKEHDKAYGDLKHDANGNVEQLESNDWWAYTKLSPEAIAAIRDVPELWRIITEQGDYRWVYDSLSEYADQAGKVSEQIEKLAEKLTLLSDTKLHDLFHSELMDMEKDAKDFGKDFSEILMKAVMDAQIGNELDSELKAWRNKLATKMRATGGKLTDADVKELRDEWNNIVQEGIELRDEMARVTGYDKTYQEQQKATANSIQNISYEQADSLVGIGLAAQIIMEQELAEVINQGAMLMNIETHTQNISAQVVSINEGVRTMLETQDSMNNHLAAIRANTNVLPEVRDEIVRVRRLVEEQ